MNKKDFEKLIKSVRKLGKSSIDGKIMAAKTANILVAVLSCLTVLTVSVGGFIFFMAVLEIIPLGIIFALLFPLGPAGVFIWIAFFNPFNKRHGFLRAMHTIAQRLSVAPLVYFTDIVFTSTPIRTKTKRNNDGTTYKVNTPISLDAAQAEELSWALIKAGQLTDNEIIGGKAIVRQGFGIDEQEATAQKEATANKKIVLDMSSIGEHKSCHNCGAEFMEGETFCGFCGTKRKDIRRRV